MRLRNLYAVLAVLVVFSTGCSAPLTSGAGDLVTRITERARALGGQLLRPSTVTYAAVDTPSVAWVSSASASACRSGPGPSYSVVLTTTPGMKYRILGSDTPDNFWIVTDQSAAICWLPKPGAVVTGNSVGLPEYTISSAPSMPTATLVPTATPTGPSPTPTVTPTTTPTRLPRVTATPPLAPTGLHGSRTCAASTQNGNPVWVESISLAWFNTHGELGFTVLQNGNPIAQVAQNSTYYQLQLQYNQGASPAGADTFAVQAFNRGGTSPQMSISIPRCP